MRRLLLLTAIALIATACDPQIRRFEVAPGESTCATEVTISWRGDADGLRLRSDPPTVPPLPATVDKEGELRVAVQRTTRFSASYPGAGHRERTFTLGQVTEQTLVFNGICEGPARLPTYPPVSIGANVAPGLISRMRSDFNAPIDVDHLGETINLNAGDIGPFGPLPPLAAAGDYRIVIVGKPGFDICQNATPGTPAPRVRLFVTGSCPTL